jgi:branched-chain amino acid transport system permease protein
MRTRSSAIEIVASVIAFAILAAIPMLTASHAVIDFIIRCSALALFATSLNLLVGYAGMVSFGHGMFFGLGAYAFGLLMQRTGLPIPAAIVASIAVTAATAAVVGAICIRLHEIYFAFVTLAFQMLLYSLIISWVPLTGGDQGLRGGIPRPVFFGIDLANQTQLCIASAALLVGGLLLMRHITESPFGYTLRLARDNPVRAAFLGIAVYRVRLMVFVLSSVFAALGGIIMSLFVSGAYPELAYWTMSGEAVFIIMLGGLGTFLGPTVGTVILLLLNDVVTRFTEYYGLTLGAVILLFALGLRKGLLDFIVDAVGRGFERRPVLSEKVAR